MYGRVTNYFTDRGYGFVRGEDNNSYFVHHSQLKEECMERGYYVSFKIFSNNRSDYNARDIVVIESTDRQSNTQKGIYYY
ncbi:cold shock protein 1 [Lachnospiraceae bacterium]|nr:cold shock protein 1 [Lachnospiraceae bacterium]